MSCRILLTTSLDPSYPEENMLDGNEKTYWISTGMFPQEILVEITDRRSSTIKIASTGIKELKLEVSKDDTDYPVNFATQDTLRLDNSNRLQYTDLQLPQARFLKLVILSGYSEFPTVHKLELI